MTSHSVKLRVNGTDFAGFKSGEISLGLDQLCSSFLLSYFDARGSQAPTPIDDGDRCTLLIDDRVIMDGWVDESKVEYDAKSYKADVSGRSTTCDLVDCTSGIGPGGARSKSSWKNTPITAIIADILNPYSLQARFVGETGANFSKFRLQRNETCGDAITRLVRSRGFVAYTVGSDLVVGRAGAESTQTVIRSGDQVLRGHKDSSKSGRFSHYIFKGQTRANDTVNGVNASQLDGAVEDRNVERFRPLVIVKGGQDSKADLGQLAVLERNQRAGRGERLTYTIHGWERQEGLWTPNVRVRVVDTFMDVDCEMLVVNVTYRFGSSDPGFVTELELSRPEAYDVIDYPVRRRGSGIRDAAATFRPPNYGNTPGGLGYLTLDTNPSYGVLRPGILE
jgi:prophage tail gpP-like protein